MERGKVAEERGVDLTRSALLSGKIDVVSKSLSEEFKPWGDGEPPDLEPVHDKLIQDCVPYNCSIASLLFKMLMSIGGDGQIERLSCEFSIGFKGPNHLVLPVLVHMNTSNPPDHFSFKKCMENLEVLVPLADLPSEFCQAKSIHVHCPSKPNTSQTHRHAHLSLCFEA
ncbi:hypothetical protein Dimus_034610 [Dionaea muscipula]